MKSFKVCFLLIILLPSFALANDSECNDQASEIKKIISNINTHKKLCESLDGKDKVKCYSKLTMKYNNLSRVMFYAENICSVKDFSVVKSLKENLL